MIKGLDARKKRTLTEFRKTIVGSPYIYDLMEMAHTVLDIYIANGREIRRCKRADCGKMIGITNKSGLCRRCYLNNYRKKDQQRRLGALRARYYRKRNKLKACTNLVETLKG